MFGLILLLVIALYVFLIAPAARKPDDSQLRGWLYAHRGLHDGNRQVPENSLSGFGLAVENGYGMELDVQLTKDEKLVVHHDASLKRVCGIDKLIASLTYDELCRIPLPDGSHIPLFSEVLELVDGRTPLIVEVKHYGNPERNAAATLEALKDYHGAFCVESFDPKAMRYFRKHAPHITRGQLAAGGKWNKQSTSFGKYFALKYLLINHISRPHFVAYSVPQDRSLSIMLMKRCFKPYLAAWTIRSQDVLDAACRDGYRYPIFERFIPKKKA